MKRRNILLISGTAILLIALGGILFVFNKPAEAPNTNGQADTGISEDNEQKIESTRQQQEELSMRPDINNEEFVIVGSNVSCSTTSLNGNTSRICSGNIRIIPKGNDSVDQGLYKINEQTKLLHSGQEQNLDILRQLAEDRTTVRLTLAENSEEMLAEIRY